MHFFKTRSICNYFRPQIEPQKYISIKLALDPAEQNPQKVGPLDGGQQHQRAADELDSGPDQLPPGVQHPATPWPLRWLSQDAELGGRDSGGGAGEGTQRATPLQDPRQPARVGVSIDIIPLHVRSNDGKG